MIKRKKIDISEERRILSQMIVSTPFLSELRGIATPTLFKSPFSITVANWVREFFEYTNQAPGKGIEDIYLKNQHSIEDEEENELIGEFLTRLSGDWEKHQIKNIKYSVKNAIEFFKLRSLELLKKDIDEAIQNKNAKHGERIIAEYKRVDKIKGHGVNFLKNPGAIKSAFEMEYEFLFSYPKLLGKAMGPFYRGDFYAIMGPAKRGKTWYLMHLAIRAVLMGMKVSFISLEMNEGPVLRRFWKGFTGLPSGTNKIEIPVFEEGGKDGKFKVAINTLNKKGMDLNTIEKNQNKYIKASRGGELRIHTYPSFGATLRDIEDYHTNLEYYEGFIPDVIIIDYADIISPENTRTEARHQINEVWKGMRGMAQKREALVATGTHSGKIGLDKDVSESNIAEDSRKLAHITKLGILNQNILEREAGVMRFTTGIQREQKAFTKQLIILQSLEIGRPYLSCKLRDDVDMTPFEIKKEKSKKK